MEPGLIDILFASIFLIIIFIFSIDQKKPYPPKLLELYKEPGIRFLLYCGLIFVANFSVINGLLLTMFMILLHVDYVNLYSNSSVPSLFA
jgi:hypothetical protein